MRDDALQDADGAARARQRDLVRRGYDAISRAYRSDDCEPDGSTAEDTSRYAGWVADLARLLPPAAQVLDLGCGAGIPATRELDDHGLRVIGVDFSAVQLRRAVEAHVRYHATHREDALVGNREIESLDQPARTQVVELRRTYEHGLRAIIEGGCAAGDFATAHARLVSYAILDMGMGLTAWYRPDGEYDIDALAYAYANLAAQMVGGRPAV